MTPPSEPASDVETEEQRLRRQAAEYGLPLVTDLSDAHLDPTLVVNLPVEWARTNLMLPIRMEGRLCVLTSDATRLKEQHYLAILLGQGVEPVLAPREVVQKSIERCYYRKHDSPTEFLRDLDRDVEGIAPSGPGSPEDLLSVAENAPVTQLINLILLEAVKKGASDIHFEPFEDRLRIRYRIDGILYEQTAPPKTLESLVVSRLKVMAKLDIAERRLPQDGMARVRVGEREIDLRVSTIPVAEGERVVLRLLDRDASLLPLTALGMNAATLASMERLLATPHGMIIVCGPTGSGKTTTLYAALARLDASRRNILTIEDPVEYRIPHIGQMQVKPKIGLTFSVGLRHILRQDPDVILVGEIRDRETADIAIRAGLTGHLVLTTLHTNDAPGAVLRLIDIGVENYLVAACLRAALAQRLVRRLCTACRHPIRLPAEQLAAWGHRATRLASASFYQAVGCEACLGGYRGRVGLFELLTVGPEEQAFIRSTPPDGISLRRFADTRGMRSLLDDGLDKVLDGTTDLAEVQAVLG